MNKLAISSPEHGGRLFHSYLIDGSFNWSDPVDITDSFLNDRTKTFVGGESSLRSFSDNISSKDRFIMYYDEATTLDKIYLSGLTQASGLTFDVYHDNVSVGTLPATLLVNEAQAVIARPRLTANQLLTFADTTATCFMVEVSGIQSSLGNELNLLISGDFESGIGVGWSSTGFGINIIEQSDNNYLQANFTGFNPPVYLTQTFDTSTVTTDMEISLEYSTLEIDYGINGAFVNVNTADGTLSTSTQINQFTPNTRYTETFIYPAAQNSMVFRVGGSNVGGDTAFQIDNIRLTTSTEFYSTEPVDYRAIFFGVKSYSPDYNYNYGGSIDNSKKYEVSQTQSSHYQFKTNSARADQLTIDHESPASIASLEYLGYTLNNGYCFYQRDESSTDPHDYFLANFSHGARSNDFKDWNSMPITFQEAHEWR